MSASHVFCSKCGTQNESGARFCSACGASLAAPPPPPPPPAAVLADPLTPAYQAPPKASNLPLFAAMGTIFLLLIAVFIEAAIILFARGSGQEVGATLSALEGQVFVQRGGSGDWIKVAEEFAVRAGDRIRVAEASHAVLGFMEDTTAELGSLTELTIEDLQTARGQPVVIKVDLELGEMWNRVADLPVGSLHEISTASVRVTCYGSQYGLAVNDVGTSFVTVQEGEFEVSGGGRTVRPAPGDTLVVEPGSPPMSYRDVAMLPASPAIEPSTSVSYTLQSADLPTFLNRPLPTGTPTNTPTATPTRRPATATPIPKPTATATPKPISCPTLKINVPSSAFPKRVFGLEWDALGAPVPAGYSFAVEFSPDQASWNRTPPLRPREEGGELWFEGGHWHAELSGPGTEGTWYWRVCLVKTSDPTGPSVCCGPTHPIDHGRGGHEEPSCPT